MKILFIGDVSGSPGREIVAKVLPGIRKQEKVDFVIANAENAAGGLGVTKDVLNELISAGVDYFTGGDHVWKVKDFLSELSDTNLPIVRPYNYEKQEQLPGKGYSIIDLGKHGRMVLINMLGQTFMNENVRNPFWSIDELLDELKEEGIDNDKDIIIVDFHAEATAEKISFGYYLKNRVGAVLGTHTHVATADERIIDGTAFVTDVGMAGPYDASLWAEFEGIWHNFKFPFKVSKKVEKTGSRIFNSVLIDFNGGRAESIKRVDKVEKK